MRVFIRIFAAFYRPLLIWQPQLGGNVLNDQRLSTLRPVFWRTESFGRDALDLEFRIEHQGS